MQALDNYISEIRTLPPAPRVLSELLMLLGEEETPYARIVELVSYDPALTAMVLQRCNSAAYGFAGGVSDLDDAVKKIGFNTIYRLVALALGEGILASAAPGYGIAPGALWEHSATAAVAARLLAEKHGGEENLAFTSALMHDVGKLALSVFLQDSDRSIPCLTGPSGLSFLEAERAVLGVEHAEIGGRVLEGWNFPSPLVNAVRYHHDPAQDRLHEQLASFVHVGDVIAHCIGQSQEFAFYAHRIQPEALEILGVRAEEMDGLVQETNGALKQCSGLIRTKP